MFEYYLSSRSVSDFDALVSLFLADRIKQSLSDGCIRHVLSVEASAENGWLPYDKLAEVVDTYYANHPLEKPRPQPSNAAKVVSSKPQTVTPSDTAKPKVTTQETDAKAGGRDAGAGAGGKLCYRCKSADHLIAACPMKNRNSEGSRGVPYTRTGAKTNRCAVESVAINNVVDGAEGGVHVNRCVITNVVDNAIGFRGFDADAGHAVSVGGAVGSEYEMSCRDGPWLYRSIV